MAKIHGGQVIARALRAEGVDTIFTLTGGHIVGILDGCVQEGIRVIDVRHEQTAVFAAEAYTRLTGTLGVAAVTAGPGVTNAMTGVATASWSHTPLLLLGGRHFIRQELLGGLQEMDHPRLFEAVTKWRATAWETNRLAEYVATAARHAFSGRGGPVFLDVPMDVQFDMVDADAIVWPTHYRDTVPQGAMDSTVDQVVATLAGSTRPVIFAGGGFAGSGEELTAVVEALQAPVYLNSRARGAVPAGHPLLGAYARSAAFATADVVLAVGVDWDFRTGYGRNINPDAIVVQIDAEPTRVGWNRPAHVAVVADAATVVRQLADRSAEFKGDGVFAAEIMEKEAVKRAQAEAAAADDSSPVMPQRFARDVADFFGSDAILSVDGGDIVSTTARWLRTSTAGHLLDPGPFGTLGTGAPYAIAAKVAFPDAVVGTIYGDGGFGFNGMEYDTMVRLGLPIIGVVGNDGQWSNIKTFHQAFYPERVVAADLGVQRYDRMVEGLGGYGEFVTDPQEISPALERAKASGLPALVNVHLAQTIRMSSNYSQ